MKIYLPYEERLTKKKKSFTGPLFAKKLCRCDSSALPWPKVSWCLERGLSLPTVSLRLSTWSSTPRPGSSWEKPSSPLPWAVWVTPGLAWQEGCLQSSLHLQQRYDHLTPSSCLICVFWKISLCFWGNKSYYEDCRRPSTYGQLLCFLLSGFKMMVTFSQIW